MTNIPVQLTTLEACSLAIGAYPPFRYNARNGGGTGQLNTTSAKACQPLIFEPGTLQIPALNWRTTRFLGLPLPPGFNISIQPSQLSGFWHAQTGEVDLRFQAKFLFRLGKFVQG